MSLTNHGSAYRSFHGRNLSVRDKLEALNWNVVLLIGAIACVGFAVLY